MPTADMQSRAASDANRATTVLIVDDQIGMLRYLQQFLEARSYHVEIAASVDDAMGVIQRGVDAVVLDVRMPRRSGLDLLEFIRANRGLREVPVLILTGATLTADEEAIIARNHGYVFYKSESQDLLALYLDQLTHHP